MVDGTAPLYRNVEVGAWRGVVLLQSRPGEKTQIAIENPEVWQNWLRTMLNGVRALSGSKALKISDSVEVWETEFSRSGGQSPLRIICKQRKPVGPKQALADLFLGSPARRQFSKALRLLITGIATAQPLAYVERKSPRASWIILEFLDGVVELDTFVLTRSARSSAVFTRAHRNAVIQALANLFIDLVRANLYHRDMKASNILLAGAESATPQACIVDLEGLEPIRPWRSNWKPVVRLAASLLQYQSITRTDYARFLRNYLIASNKDGRAWRVHFPRLRKQAARYARAAYKRKFDKLDGFTGDALSHPG